jgi:S-methylmethionine-dependent homocysteine/selenocysteine methylase
MRYRDSLPQLAGTRCITDGGMETTLIFHRGMELPLFAAFDLLKDDEGVEALRSYFTPYIEVAKRYEVGIVLDTPTWRASSDWGEQLGYSADDLDRLNRRGVTILEELRAEHESERTPLVIAGCVGPRGDGYVAGDLMSADEAERYHAAQVGTFAGTNADLVGALTMTYVDEAVGIVRAASSAGMPIAVSFTVETDGRLPSGQPLREAVEQVDRETGAAAAYFMVNCAHPTHFAQALEDDGPWLERLMGIRANASTKSHAELDEAESLDEGDPADLGARYGDLDSRLPHFTVAGGCCGTDHRHVEEICRTLTA